MRFSYLKLTLVIYILLVQSYKKLALLVFAEPTKWFVISANDCRCQFRGSDLPFAVYVGKWMVAVVEDFLIAEETLQFDSGILY